MLIHLAPCCMSPWIRTINLISVEIPELSLTLNEGEHLRTRCPYPNKHYFVASAAADRAAKDGFFVETNEPISEFRVITRWMIAGQTPATTHHKFTILDSEFDATSTDATMWGGVYNAWEDRWPDAVPSVAPNKIQPRLELDFEGNIVHGKTDFPLPTLERERVLDRAGSLLSGNRCPSVEAAFRASPLTLSESDLK